MIVFHPPCNRSLYFITLWNAHMFFWLSCLSMHKHISPLLSIYLLNVPSPNVHQFTCPLPLPSSLPMLFLLTNHYLPSKVLLRLSDFKTTPIWTSTLKLSPSWTSILQSWTMDFMLETKFSRTLRSVTPDYHLNRCSL